MIPAWLGGIAASVVCVAVAYLWGMEDGKAVCEARTAQATAELQRHVNRQTSSAIARSNTAGTQREHARAAIEQHFDRLQEEADHEAFDPADECVLPAERLRRWAAANAGAADPGAPASQPDDGTAAAAGPGLRPPARPGGEPSGGGEGLPPAGQPALQPAGLPGDPA